MIRESVWAGSFRFYPDDQDKLLKYIRKVTDEKALKQDVKVVILPHAGYAYSGAVAGKTISYVNVPDTAIIRPLMAFFPTTDYDNVVSKIVPISGGRGRSDLNWRQLDQSRGSAATA